MTYQEFREYVTGHIKDYLPDSYQDAEVWIRTKVEVNDRKTDMLLVRRQGENFAPVIYLEEIYQVMENQELDVPAMLRTVAEMRLEREKARVPDVRQLMDREEILKNARIRVINYEANEAYLSDKPCVRAGDFAITFYIPVEEPEGFWGNGIITYDFLRKAEIDVGELYEKATGNTERESPAKLYTMNEMLSLLEKEDGGEAALFMDGDAYPPVYVLTNQEKYLGAAALFYPGAQERLSEVMHGDYIVIPSSVHEVLVIPERLLPDGDLQEIDEMVQAVNGTEVKPEEVLGSGGYYYDHTNGILMSLEKRRLMCLQEQKEFRPQHPDPALKPAVKKAPAVRKPRL